MKRILCIVAAMLTLLNTIVAQSSTLKDSIATCFKDVKEATFLNKELWNRDIYGPFLLINRQTREVYANMPDSAGVLTPCGDDIYCGTLPKEKIISNTSTKWNGTQWATVMLPLDKNKTDRLNLCTHELFHASQPALGFSLQLGDNGHLDTKDGRLCLRLELAALEKALLASQKREVKRHVYHALLFRKYRYQLFAKAKVEENKNELNEGIANYTGIYMSAVRDAERKGEFVRNLRNGQAYNTFVMGYAYLTIPSYGYILSKRDKGWNRKIGNGTNLTDFFWNAFRFNASPQLNDEVKRAAIEYGGEILAVEEQKREHKQQEMVGTYTDLLVVKPHLFLKNIKMNIGFSPIEAISLEEHGTIYPTLTVSDAWGSLTVKKGGLLAKNWSGVTVSAITRQDNSVVEGDGWVLKINPRFSIVKDQNGNWGIQEKQDK
jgi:hypothetical protein